MRPGLEILASGVAGGAAGALGGYRWARGSGAAAGAILLGTLGLVIGSVRFT